MIEATQSGDGALLGTAIVVAVSLDELDVAAFAGAGDFDEHATTIFRSFSYVKYSCNVTNVPLHEIHDLRA